MQATGDRLALGRREQLLELIAIVALAVVYMIDVLTPADLSVEVAYEVPVAIVGFGGSRRAFIRMTGFAAFLNVAGYLGDALLGPSDWVAFQNRLISLASLTVVCTLMIVVRRAGERAMLAASIEQRHRELLDHQRLIEELVETIAHDVRTPLAALSLTLKQAVRGDYGVLPDAYRDVASESRTSIDDISRLADTLLAVARFEAGAAMPDTSPVPLAPIGAELASEFAPLLTARHLNFRRSIADGSVVAANAADVRRALGNLIANAVRHTPPGGTIEVNATRTASGWRIAVSDDGVGVDESALPTLFERGAAGGSSSGLGLHIVKRIAECFGGKAAFEPVSPTGSCFWIELPEAAA